MAKVSGINPASNSGIFASLANKEYALLWSSGLVAFLAVGMQILARGWLAIQLTDSNTSFALVLVAFGLGMVTLTPFGGVAADRFPRRGLILGSHYLLLLSALWLGIAVLLGAERFWMLLAVSFLQGGLFAFMGPARLAMISELVGPELVSNAISLTQLTVASTQTFGPAVAGILVDVPNFGLAGVYLLSAGLTALSVIPVWMLPKVAVKARQTASPLRELAEALAYVAAKPLLRVVVFSTTLGLLVSLPYVAFLPAYAESVFGVGALWLGIFQAANAFGGTIAALRVAKMRDNARLWRLRVFSLSMVALGLAALAITPNQYFALPVLVVLGGASIGFQTANMSMPLLLSEPVYHGRVQSLIMVAFSLQALITLPLGALADQLGLRAMLAIMAASVVLVLGYSVVAGNVARQQS